MCWLLLKVLSEFFMRKRQVSFKVGPSRSRKRGKTCRQKVFSAFRNWEPGEVLPCKWKRWVSLPYDEVCPSKSRQMRNRIEEDKPGRSLKLDCSSSSWGRSKDVTIGAKIQAQDGRRHYSTYYWQRAHIWSSYKQIRDKPTEKSAGLINRPSQKGLSK